MYVAKIEHKACKIYSSQNGSLKRTLCSGKAESADVSGDEVAVTCSDGKVRVYDIDDGHLIRTF